MTSTIDGYTEYRRRNREAARAVHTALGELVHAAECAADLRRTAFLVGAAVCIADYSLDTLALTDPARLALSGLIRRLEASLDTGK